MKEMGRQTRLYRERMLADPYRPSYHFAIPDGDGYPGDPNGAFYADGRYHLMYLYRNETTDAFHWGHISSADLLHWRSHPDALTQLDGDKGCFSGGAFVDDDGTAYLTFWKFSSVQPDGDNGGIDIAMSRPPYDVWERIRPIAIEGERKPWGVVDIAQEDGVLHVGCADPSNIWKMNGMYYMQTGNKCVLDEYGRKDDSPAMYRGDWVDLFKSPDLKSWTFVHRFYDNPQMGIDGWPDETEDDMCPSFLPLYDRQSGGAPTGKWLQLFISHNKGGQYYIGEMKDERFIPEQHGRFTWVDNTLFAPEALVDGKGRQLAWFWLLDNIEGDYASRGWSCVYNFPRALWYEDGMLRMAPAEELDSLQCREQTFCAGKVEGCTPLAVHNGESFRIKASIVMGSAERAGFAVRCDDARGERTEVYYDRVAGELVMDCTMSGRVGRTVREAAPFALCEGEALELDVFVDKSVIEVYAGGRQAICRRAYPTDPAAATGVCAISDGADFGTVCAWEMNPTNPY